MTEIHPDAPTIVLYSKPGCGQCVATAKALTARGIPFVKVDVSVDANAAARVRDLGYRSLPVVVVGDMHWSGFQLDKIQQLEVALKNWTPSAPIPDGGDHA
ncbi:glutaredoxin family protein [Nocardia otitidiscaviarum]|uniref:glutaredoxin family protein n=1 Tax=Nocardia otitidiscaviarum TaxID=1823 RepID=UPI00069441B1|nr:glutaredoxin family protein [Nocardia otitidiscaviarum]